MLSIILTKYVTSIIVVLFIIEVFQVCQYSRPRRRHVYVAFGFLLPPSHVDIYPKPTNDHLPLMISPSTTHFDAQWLR
ncbi:hypothetical protein BDZ89DRAFT_1058629 [Hymenopellis radicata]|nr:hypothetical protein BDZ89DRAFT_1058629 [Hymenopellis radicata]